MRNLLCLLALIIFISCNKDSDIVVNDGSFSHEEVNKLAGFTDYKKSLISKENMSEADFNKYSVLNAAEQTSEIQTSLKNIRIGVKTPTQTTLLQKVIPLEDVTTYMNNIYGGTVGGFICDAADVKELVTQTEVIRGLRLDYDGTKFREDGAGYAVVRFKTLSASELYIPFCPELGGTTQNPWPFTGCGFTASSLGEGGYPEYSFNGYKTPNEGSELYEVTPNGYEILRSVFKDSRWQTFEKDVTKGVNIEMPDFRNGLYGEYKNKYYRLSVESKGIYRLVSEVNIDGFEFSEISGLYCKKVSGNELSSIVDIQTKTKIDGIEYNLRGEQSGRYILTTTSNINNSTQIERGLFQITVPKESVLKYEIISKVSL